MNDDEIDGLRERIDLAAYVGKDVALTPEGNGMYMGTCPFCAAGENRLRVHGVRRVWHCFHCGASGDVISWVMRRRGVEFAEAVRELGGVVQ